MSSCKTIALLAVLLVFGILSVLAAKQAKPAAQAMDKAKSPVSVSQIRRGINLVPCLVSGQLTLDPSDETHGFFHYKGEITFYAAVHLEGVNLSLDGPKYACTCATCPSLSSNAAGLKPEGKFNAGQEKTYKVDCGSLPAINTLNGPLGKGKIQYFVRAWKDAGNFKWADCSGTFSFND